MHVALPGCELLVLLDGVFRLLGVVHGLRVVTVPAVLGVVLAHLVPHLVGETPAFLVELLLGRDRAAHLGDRVGDALFRFDEQLLRVLVRNVAVDAHGAHAGPVVVVPAQLVFRIDELLVRVAGRAAELVGACDGHGDLRADDHHGTDHEPDKEQREHRPARRWRKQPAPRPPERARGLRGCHGTTWTRERWRRPPSGPRRSRRSSCGHPHRRSSGG